MPNSILWKGTTRKKFSNGTIGSKSDTISATDLINIGSRVPKRIKRRRFGREAEAYSTGTVTRHYLSFQKATPDEMDKYLEIKEHYLVTDNAPIHSSIDIGKYIYSRVCRCAYLPHILSS
ncbi:hypothetical protein RO3G_10133 [Rhizopus delemar RA 99-880]|uniref:Tc1-like transposase DDE domain-containing protein n=1 Tax=Rhizopus delemar (strain RA 99-880 / ATCC MYA-4621 / FGSC 9543 / NRRL 43880) TaxID=246409 RepID=I1CAE3_RHIO9|nr:hypothetical protein RO3G_10133 [Rhizopus delemar RA 99-880]|eukprot:EIE85423.1 hypothetical protein RO3G_10133 [Rhizopus delemar RA 99-880]